MNTETNQEMNTISNLTRLAVLLDPKGRELFDIEYSDTLLNAVVARAMAELTDFVRTLEPFPANDYRNVDAALLRWCVELGKTDPIEALIHQPSPNHTEVNEEISGAYRRLAGRDRGYYLWHTCGAAVGLNWEYFPE